VQRRITHTGRSRASSAIDGSARERRKPPTWRLSTEKPPEEGQGDLFGVERRYLLAVAHIDAWHRSR
jgi:hypothetical protein